MIRIGGETVLATQRVMREAAGGEHHADPGAQLDLAGWRAEHGTGDALTIAQQRQHAHLGAQFHSQIGR